MSPKVRGHAAQRLVRSAKEEAAAAAGKEGWEAEGRETKSEVAAP